MTHVVDHLNMDGVDDGAASPTGGTLVFKESLSLYYGQTKAILLYFKLLFYFVFLCVEFLILSWFISVV